MGFELVFSAPLASSSAANTNAYVLSQWLKKKKKTVASPLSFRIQYSPGSNDLEILFVGKPKFTRGGQFVLKPSLVESSAGGPLVGKTVFTVLKKGKGVL